jgi:SsrA-binding protein
VSSKKKQSGERFTEVRNKKASHKYFIDKRFEAGIALRGTEVKSIRAGKAQIADAFVRIDKGLPILYNAHVEAYEFGNIHNHDPRRPRPLLIHKKEIRELQVALEAKGLTIVPLRLYLKKGLVKVEIALCRGKQLHDKRQDVKLKMDMREAERALHRRR